MSTKTDLEEMAADDKTRKFIDDFVNSIAKMLTGSFPRIPENLNHIIQNASKNQAEGSRFELPNEPSYAEAMIALREKAVEICPSFVENYKNHMARQKFPAQIIKSHISAVLLIYAGSYIGWGIGKEFNIPGPYPFLGVNILGCAAGYWTHKLASALIDRRANAEKKNFKTQVKQTFYQALERPR
ncbi:TPA: hypothetical protein HA231_05810 [Candidatus Woesearchaeota archaeon]|nr:hypothetical protein [Candidatus Woesearchaeota archaeon]